METNDYHHIEYWINNPTCTKISIDGVTYTIEDIKHFVIDSYVMQSVLVYLSDNKLLVITRYGEINSRCLYQVDVSYEDRYQAQFIEGYLFDVDIISEVLDHNLEYTNINICDAKYETDIVEENKSIDNMIFDKCYEAYGTIDNTDVSIVEYLCSNDTITNKHLLFVETGNLYADGGGSIVKYRGREIFIDYICDDDIITVECV